MIIHVKRYKDKSPVMHIAETYTAMCWIALLQPEDNQVTDLHRQI